MTASAVKVAGVAAAALCVWEVGWWARRRARRGAMYAAARERATLLGRPLVVIGAPDKGSTGGYGCGDITVDLVPSCCPHTIIADITKVLPFSDNSVVVFCSCVLEYVCDAEAAVREIERVSGGQAYFVGVEPWTLTAYLYPGRQRTLPGALR